MKKTLLLAAGFLSFGLMNAQVIEIPDPGFKTLLTDASPNNITAKDANYNYITIDTNADGEIDTTEAAAVYHLFVGDAGISSVAGVEHFANLESLECSGNMITSLNVSGMTSLRDLSCSTNQLTALDVSGLTNLGSLSCSDNMLTSLITTGCTSLTMINCPYNQLSSLSVNELPALESLTCNDNALTALDISGMPSLTFLNCEYNHIETLNLQGSPNLDVLLLAENQITELDLSGCQPDIADCDHNQIAVLIIKNGHDDSEAFIEFSENPLQYLCIDESEAETYQEILDYYGYSDVVLGSYCTFTPGGNYNTISGITSFDATGEGCVTSGPAMGFVRINMSAGTESATTFSSHSGQYDFYTQEGTFTLTPELENEWFTISPESATVTFDEVNNSVNTQNFCITPNGTHSDAEVLIIPIETAQPGFDAVYEILIRNRGNQALSGTVTFTYDDEHTDLVSALPVENTAGENTITWSYSDLMPFERRSYRVTLNVNSPQDTPAVNLDDVLAFSATVTPTDGDETPGNNVFMYEEIVTGSFDPNDITCLEGRTATPAMIGEYLHYNINFENTGTAPATFIVVKQEIDEDMFDINTLQLLNASHDIKVKIEGNVVEYRFDVINLGPLEKGNLVFRIKTVEALQTGDEVTQKANIYFDYNWPIETNEAVTAFEVLGTNDHTLDNSVKIYPNPSTGMVNIASESMLTSLQLYDLQGRLLQTMVGGDTSAILDITGRSKGIYLLKVTSEKGLKVERIVKE